MTKLLENLTQRKKMKLILTDYARESFMGLDDFFRIDLPNLETQSKLRPQAKHGVNTPNLARETGGALNR
jgi:hypothetical protein